MDFSIIKIETFIPIEYVDVLREELNKVGALTIGGNYDNCMSYSMLKGSFRPLENANPFSGEANKLSIVDEAKVEFSAEYKLLKIVIDTIKRVHPYEVPVINVIPTLNIPL